MASDAPGAKELTRRLVARAAEQTNAPDNAALVAHAACERTYRELARRFGSSGSDALFARALAQATTDYPLLRDIRIGRVPGVGANGVQAAIEAQGIPDVTTALEAVLEKLLGLLGRLIGDDMAARLVESATIETNDDEDGK